MPNTSLSGRVIALGSTLAATELAPEPAAVAVPSCIRVSSTPVSSCTLVAAGGGSRNDAQSSTGSIDSPGRAVNSGVIPLPISRPMPAVATSAPALSRLREASTSRRAWGRSQLTSQGAATT